ncbi:Vomp family autotransporter [Bartonella krasnovii]|uniref:Vomp family autotransporter n=1 Tax=Bartonella krasnovii TaxID=2267275 RepID=UPI001F4D0DB2|nr:Vomp family autotransporter [Bartonella krasnovii]UNF55513.1 Vomp family autotransporter [Bartonella krasnovii]
MQKLHATQKASNLKVSRFSFVRVSLLAVAAISLSNISSVFASNLAITGANILSENSPAVRYSKGSHGSIVFSGDDDYCGADNVIGRGGTAGRGGKKITAEEEYRRFLEEVKFGNFSPYSQSDQKQTWTGNGHTSGNIGYMGALTGGDTNILPEAFGVYSFATGCGSAAQGSYSTAFGANATALTGGSQAFGVAALAAGKVSIAIGVGSETKGDSAVALGGLANAAGEISVAIGHKAQSTGKFAITMGDQAQATKEDSVAIGRMAKANALGSIALGAGSEVKVDGGVALGDSSVADTAAGIFGYEPRLKKASTSTDSAWQARRGAVSVGTLDRTRQITKVAAGTEYTDAVNVAQLKALQEYVDRSWKLSVDGKNARVVGIGDTVDFSAGSNNLNITKGEDDNNIKFDLAKDLTLNKVTAGANTFDDTGLIIKDGPKIVKDGIDVWNKKITNVADGTTKNDAVNFSQLQELKDLMSSKDALASWDGDRVRVGAPKNFSAKGSVVIGPLSDELELKVYPTVKAQYGIGIGMRAEVNSKSTWGVAVGYGARVNSVSGIALGAYSYSTFEAGRHGYDPRTGKESTSDNRVWKSSYGSLSIGGDYTSRQIINVAAGTDDYDAVNVAQLKALRSMIKKQGSWDLSVNDAEEKTAIGTGDTLALTAGSENLKIKNDKTENGSKVTFDLAKDLALNSIKLGEGTVPDGEKDAVSPITLDATGLIIANGPKIMATGIDAGSKKITNVADATDTTDAVNFGQLNKAKQEVQEQVEKQVAANSFVKQDTDTKHITIGKETDGDKIDITNKEGGARTLSGVKAGTEETDAVNFGQLKKIQTEVTEQVAANSFVKQDSNTKYITIGKETDGDKIDITNNVNEARILSGVKAGTESTDAVNFAQLKESTRGWKIYVGGEFKEPTAEGVSSIAIGSGASASNVNAIALGTRSQATGNAGVALGAGSVADDGGGIWGYDPLRDGVSESISYEWRSALGSVSVGDHTNKYSRQITGVAAGSRDTDAVNVVQLKSLRSYVDKGWKLSVNGKNAKAVGIDDTVDFAAGSNNLTITKSESDNKVKFDLAKDLTLDSITVGSNTLNTTGLKIANGPQITTEGINAGEKVITAVANGKIFQGSKDAINGSQLYILANSIAATLGSDTVSINEEDGAIVSGGYYSNGVDADGNITKDGYQTVASALKSIGQSFENVLNLFDKKVEDVVKTVQEDSLLWSDDAGAFVANHKKAGDEEGKEKTASKIISLAQGDINATSTDAINGSQLYTLGNNVAKSFGGDAGYENGNWKAPNFKVKTVNSDGKEDEQSYTSVAEAFEGVGTSFTNVQNKFSQEITNQINNAITNIQGESLIKKNKETNLITIGKEVAGDEINIANNMNEARTLSGVKEAAKDNEAVNKAQLDTNIKKVEDKLAEAVGNITQQVQGDALLWSNTDNAFVADHKKNGEKTKSKITHLLDGDIASGSTDAVTGGQLYSMNKHLATYFGGGAGYDAQGNWQAPSFKVKTVKKDGNSEDKNYTNVADALAGVGTSFTNVQNKFTNEITNQINHLQSDDSAVVHYDKKDGTINYGSVTFGGKDKTPTSLHNVANGIISDKSHDAVTGGQIYKIGEDIAKFLGGSAAFNNGAFTGPTYKLSYITKDGVVTENSLDSVGTAIAGLDINIKNVNDRIKEVSEGVAQDSLSWSKEANAFSAQHGAGAKTNSKIKFLAAGDIAKDSTDAINGSQLYSMNNTLATYFGGGAEYKDGKWVAPSFKVKTVKKDSNEVEEIAYDNVADAFAGMSTSITDIHNEVNNQISNIVSDSLVKQDDTGLIKIGAEKEGGAIDIANKNGEARTLSGVKEAAKDNEAVNKAQLDTNIKKVEDKLAEAVGNITQQVQGDALLWSNTDNAFVADHKKNGEKTKSKITHLLDGDIASGSTDAVTGGQLYSMNKHLATYFGGGAGYDAQGNWQAPSFKVKTVKKDGNSEDKNYTNVADALAGVGTSFTNVQNKFTNEITNQINHLQSDDSAVVHYDKKDGTINYGSVTFGGKDKTPTSLHNVANGIISDKSHDAVTGGQIYKIGEDIAKFLGGNAAFNNGAFTGPTYKLSYITKDGVVTENSLDSVGTAIAGLDINIKNVNDRIKEVSEGVAQDSLSWSKEANAFSAQHGAGAKTNSKIKFLAAGDIAKDSTDAINGSQLYSMNNTLATYFGGGAGYDKQGKWQAPNFKVKTVKEDGNSEDKNYTNVADALAGVGTSFTNVQNKFTTEITNQINRLQSDDSAVVHYDKKDGTINYGSVTFGGKDKTATALHNIADGNIAKDSHDAITGGQINTISQDVAKFLGGEASFNNGAFTQPTYKLSRVDSTGKITDSSFNDVGSAFAGLDKNIKNVNDRIKEVSEGVAQDSLSWSKEANAFSAQHGEKEKTNSKIKFLAAGDITKDSTDAINGSQLYSMNNTLATYFGGGAGYDKQGKWQAPNFKVKTVKEDGNSEDKNYTNVADALAGVGTSFTNVQNKFTTEITNQINRLQSDDSAVVHYDKKDGTINYGSVTFGGKDKTATALHNIADGNIAKDSHDAITGGQINTISQDVAKFLGGEASFNNGAFTQPTYKLSRVDSTGKITDSSFNDVGSAFAGLDINIKNVNQRIKEVSEGVAQDSLSWSKEANAFSAQHGEKEKTNSKIKFLAAGDITKDSTDAINGSQLYSMNNTLATYFGGGAEYKEGKWTAPNFKVNVVNANGDKVEEQSYDSVAKAFEGVGSSFTNLHNEVTNAVTNINNHINNVVSDSLVKQDEESKVIKIGAEKGGTSINIANSGDAARTLTGVKSGTLTETSTDAVNGSQLYSLNQTLASYFGGGAEYKEGKWTAPNFKVNVVNANGDKVEEKRYDSVAAAFEGVGNSFTNIHKELKNEINQVVGESLVKQDEKTHVIAVGGETNGTKVSFANSDGIERVLSGVKAGELSTKSTEAVNGSQLYSMSNTLATYFGGGAGYDEKGEWQAPSFKVNTVNADGKEKDETYQNVAEALAGVGTSFTNVYNKITNEINNAITKVEGDSLVKQAKETDPITIGKEVAGTEVNIANKDKEDRTLSGVKAAVNGNEAVNKAQLDQSLEKLSNSLQSDDSAVVHYDKKESGETDYTSVTLGKGKGSTPVGLHNVANGNIAKDSHDVVTGGQINTISQDVAKFLGGDTSFEKGSFTGPTYKLSEVDTHGQVSSTEFKDVGSAFAGLDKNIKNVNDRIKEVSEGVAQDSLSWSKEANAFSAQHGEGKDRTSSKITHILDGDITTNSSDAVNGSQLYSMNNTLASYFGGGAEYKEGKWVAPSFKVNVVNANGDKVEEQSYKTVAEAFAGVGSSFTNIHNEVTNAVTDINNHINNVVSDSLVKQDEESKVIKIGAEKGGTSINISNSGDAARTLTGVKSGGLTETSTDAVNGSQLYSMNNTLASYFGGGAEYKEGKWVAPSFKVNVVNANGDKVEEQSYKTVAEAFAGVGSSFTNIHKELKNEINQVVGESLVKQDEKTHVISVGGEKSGTEVTFSNTDGASRTLTGVKAGGLTETSTDAVNGSQLFATNQNVTAVTNDLKTVSENTSKFLGGGADVLKGIAPTYTVQDKSYQSVADAFGGVDRSFTALHEEIAKNTSDLSDTLKQNALLWSDKDHAFVAIHGTDADKKNSKITLLANGSITKDSTDAINGSQLYSMNNTLATYFGGGAEYKEGKWVAPSFKVNTVSADGGKVEEQSYDNVAAAFAGVGSSFTNLHNELKNEISQVVKDSLVKQDEESKVIKIGAEKEGTEITIANSDGAERSLSGVKAGTLSADSTEAVNGGQLYSLNQTLASYFGGGAEFENGQWVAPSFTILSFNEDGSSEETSYNSVSAAFAGVNRSFMKLHHELSDTVEQNALLWSDADESFVALHGKGSEKHNSKLSHLVDGDISAGSTEAITGNQLYQLNQTLAAYLGGGASYQGGEWTAPHFEVKQFKSDGSSSESKSYDNVAGAFEGVNGSLSGINDRLNDVSKNVSTNSLKWNDELEGYDGRHNGSDSKITHVADGDVSEGSKEVVNGGQLWETNQKVSAVENRVESLDQHVKDVESAVTNGAVNYDKDDAGHKTNKVTLVGGDDSAPVLIDNLAEGRIESGSKEAVTGGQLHDYTDKQMKLVLEDAKKYTDEHVTDIVNNGVSESKAYTDMKFETLNYAIEDVRKEARQAAAIGLAVSNLRYNDTPGKLSVALGAGVWLNQSAFAVGAGYTSEDGNTRSSLSVTSAGGHWGVGVGLSFTLN